MLHYRNTDIVHYYAWLNVSYGNPSITKAYIQKNANLKDKISAYWRQAIEFKLVKTNSLAIESCNLSITYIHFIKEL